MKPDLDDLKQKELNPSQKHYDDEFGRMTSSPDNKALDDQTDAAARDDTAARQSVASAEKQAIGDTAAGKVATTAAGAAGGAVGTAAAKILGKIKTKKGGAITGIITAIVLVIVGIGLIAPSAILLNLKENGGKWMTRMTNVAMHKRVRDVMEKRYFADPDSCKGITVRCRFTPGLKDAEIKKLVDAGFIKEGDVATGANGKKYLSQMTFTDSSGKVSTVTSSNFRSFYNSNLDFSSRLATIVDARSVLTRWSGALKKFSHFGVDRAKPLGDSGDEKTRLQKFRESFYGKKNSLLAGVDESQMTDEDKAKLADTMDGLQEQADELSKDAVTKGPGTIIPDTGVLDQIDPSKIFFSGLKDSLEGVFKGFFTTIDAACNLYNTIRILNFAVKAYAAAALIKYAGLFMTIADKQKDGDSASAELSLLASALLRPSVMPDSKGKDFSQSQGANLIFYGKITQPTALGRYSTGITAMTALKYVYEFISAAGVSASVCQKVLSWWGQLLLNVFGVITTILSGGAGAVSGAAIGIAKSLALSYLGQIIVPKLVPIIAGTVAPDLATDPEGGYGAGNAIANGLGALGGELGKASGMRPLTDSQLVRLSESPTARQVALLDEYEQSRRGVFDLDNPHSVQNSLAVAFTPMISRPISAADFFTGITSTIASAFSSPFQVAYAADQSILDSYGGKYCEEKTNTLLTDNADVRNLARDANCNLIYGANPDTLTDANTRAASTNYPSNAKLASTSPQVLAATTAGKFSIDSTLDYMLNNGYITNDGEPTDKGAEGDDTTSYQKFVESCVDGTDPIIDEYSADLQGSENPALCFSDKEYVDYYRTYRQYHAGAQGIQAAADDTLGYADASTAAGGDTEPSTDTPTTGSGLLAWPIKKEDWPSRTNPILNCSLTYETVASRYGDVHTGIDMMAPYGTPLYAAADGTVSMRDNGWGAINIRTNLKDGTDTLYLNYQHMSTINVSVGDIVQKDKTVVGKVGYTGSPPISNSHLHFGVWITNGFLSGRYPPDDPRAWSTLDKMRHPMAYLPEDGRNVSSCKKPYVVP